MRIRSIKPTFWRSDDIDAMTWADRLIFIGLWSYVDDNGVGLDKLSSICADLFSADLSRDPQEVLQSVSAALARFSQSGHILRYEVDGKHYLFIPSWDDHQKVNHPADPRYPRPTSENIDTQTSLFAASGDTPEPVLPVVKEKGRRGEGEKGLKASSPRAASTPSGFDEFWSIYPRKDDKPKALAAYTRKVKDRHDPEQIIAGAQRYRDDPNRDPGYTKLPTTWLNAEAWNNQPIEQPRARPTGRDLDSEVATTIARGQRIQQTADGYAYPLEISR